MKSVHRSLIVVLAAAAVAIPAASAQAADPTRDDPGFRSIPDTWNWSRVNSFLSETKDVVELSDASIIIEVNSTDGDAGFQVFLDGDGWKFARVYSPAGNRILLVRVTGGMREIGGGTELFMESEEPEYDGVEEGLRELIELLPEGEYYFLARTTDGHWATGTAELTHDVPTGPVILEPLPVEDGCTTGVFVDSALVRWDPVEMDIWDEDEVEIEGYQVIIEAEEDPRREFMAFVPADTHELMVPAEVLEGGGEFKLEILAIEESGNQTITESCFEVE